jgi:hypothetical protein
MNVPSECFFLLFLGKKLQDLSEESEDRLMRRASHAKDTGFRLGAFFRDKPSAPQILILAGEPVIEFSKQESQIGDLFRERFFITLVESFFDALNRRLQLLDNIEFGICLSTVIELSIKDPGFLFFVQVQAPGV